MTPNARGVLPRWNRLSLSLLGAALLMGQAAPTTSAGSQQPALSADVKTGTLLHRDRYRFPFPDLAAWLAFVRTLPDGASTADAYAKLYSEAQYSGWAAARDTLTSRITYASGGLRIRGVLVEPRSPGRHPVIIYNHGGIGEDGGRIVLGDLLEFNRLAARGYVVLASAYRGEGGSEGRPDIGNGDADDALALIDLAAALPSADPTRIGMWGSSRGGLTTYAALARSQRVAAAVILAGPVDLLHDPRRAEFDRFVYPDAMRGYRADPEATLTRRSPILWPDRLSPSTAILLLHGADDPRVPPAASLAMAGELQRLHRSYRLTIYEGAGHDLLTEYADVRREMDRWFDRYVRDRAPAPASGVSVLPPDVTEVE